MEQENDKEFRITLNNENDFKEYTNKNLPVGLTVSFDIGWNKCSSSSRYDSMSGHSLLIGFLSQKMIAGAISSKMYIVCSRGNKQ